MCLCVWGRGGGEGVDVGGCDTMMKLTGSIMLF